MKAKHLSRDELGELARAEEAVRDAQHRWAATVRRLGIAAVSRAMAEHGHEITPQGLAKVVQRLEET